MNLQSRLAVVGVVSIAVLGCQGDRRAASAGETEVAVDSMGVAPTAVATVPVRTRRNLRENSALAMSPDQPGALFTINDSGNEPVLFAIDTIGADRGAWRVAESTNVDWEAVAIGPCAANAPARCLYIGDVGDNDAKHLTRAIYRLPEPRAKDSTFQGTVTPRHVTFTYADRRHDVEAMYVAANADVFLITKRPLRVTLRAPQLRPALVFRIPAAAWSGTSTVVASLVDSLSIVPGSAPLRTITDASLSVDGRHLAVRTYSQLFVYETDPATGRVDRGVAPAICNLTALGEGQGEGVAWATPSGRFVFSSEGPAAPLHLANCPLPR